MRWSIALMALACEPSGTTAPVDDGPDGGGNDAVQDTDPEPTDTDEPVTFEGCASGTRVQEYIEHVGPGGTVTVCAGVHAVNVEVEHDLVLEGGGTADATTLDGSGDGATVTVGAGVELTLRHLTITGGAASAPVAGGGVNAHSAGALTLDDVVIRGNTGGVGGLSARGVKGRPVLLRNVVVSDNTGDGHAGGVYLDHAELVGVQIRGNEGLGSAAGGISVETAVSADAATVIEGNTAAYLGGGIALSSGGTWTGGTIRANTAEIGGGIGLWEIDDLWIADVVVTENVAVDGAGIGAEAEARSDLHSWLRDSAVTDNIALDDGGGLHWENERGRQVVLNLRNTLVSGNSAEDAGGGIWVRGYELYGDDGTEIRENTAGRGAGVYLDRGLVSLEVVDVVQNVATGLGGGVLMDSRDTRLVSLASNWGSAGLDNTPDDVNIREQVTYGDYGALANFSCNGDDGVCGL